MAYRPYHSQHARKPSGPPSANVERLADGRLQIAFDEDEPDQGQAFKTPEALARAIKKSANGNGPLDVRVGISTLNMLESAGLISTSEAKRYAVAHAAHLSSLPHRNGIEAEEARRHADQLMTYGRTAGMSASEQHREQEAAERAIYARALGPDREMHRRRYEAQAAESHIPRHVNSIMIMRS